MNYPPNEIVSDVNMFRPGLKDRIANELLSRLVVIKDSDLGEIATSELFKESDQEH